MSKADKAYEAALKEIARVKATRGSGVRESGLRLSGEAFNALDRLPPELATLKNDVATLHLKDTQVSDLAPLQGLTNLQRLCLDRSKVRDLRPISGLEQIELENTAWAFSSATPKSLRVMPAWPNWRRSRTTKSAPEKR